MSFGGPGGLQKASKPIPPERGSFPLEYVCSHTPLASPQLQLRMLELMLIVLSYGYSHDGMIRLSIHGFVFDFCWWDGRDGRQG